MKGPTDEFLRWGGYSRGGRSKASIGPQTICVDLHGHRSEPMVDQTWGNSDYHLYSVVCCDRPLLVYRLCHRSLDVRQTLCVRVDSADAFQPSRPLLSQALCDHLRENTNDRDGEWGRERGGGEGDACTVVTTVAFTCPRSGSAHRASSRGDVEIICLRKLTRNGIPMCT